MGMFSYVSVDARVPADHPIRKLRVAHGAVPAPDASRRDRAHRRGSKYCSREHRALLDEHGLIVSMRAIDNCYDNAAMKSWNRSLKVEQFAANASTRATTHARTCSSTSRLTTSETGSIRRWAISARKRLSWPKPLRRVSEIRGARPNCALTVSPGRHLFLTQ